MFYHMLGKHVGTLLVKTKSDDDEEEVHFEKSGNVGKNWNRLELNLDLKPGSKVNVDHGEQTKVKGQRYHKRHYNYLYAMIIYCKVC